MFFDAGETLERGAAGSGEKEEDVVHEDFSKINEYFSSPHAQSDVVLFPSGRVSGTKHSHRGHSGNMAAHRG